MKMNRYSLLFLTLLSLFLLSRFIGLSQSPPLGVTSIWLRVLTVVASLLCVTVGMLHIQKRMKSERLSLCFGFALSTLPVFLVHSRLYSPFMLALSVVMLGYFISTVLTQRVLKFAALLISGFFCVWILYLTHNPIFELKLSPVSTTLSNIFRVSSIEFLFYKDDSYWKVGLRNYGFALPMQLPLFLFGLYELIKIWRKKYFWHVGVVVGILLLTISSKFYPEAPVVMFLAPYLAFIIALGMRKIISIWKTSGTLVKVLVFIWMLLFSYDIAGLAHYYMSHYTKRIQYEIPYESRLF